MRASIERDADAGAVSLGCVIRTFIHRLIRLTDAGDDGKGDAAAGAAAAAEGARKPSYTHSQGE